MSRHNVSNPIYQYPKIRDLLANKPPEARLLWGILDNSSDNLLALAGAINGLFLPASSALDRSDRITALLGNENLRIVYQIPETIDLGVFAALCGTVPKNGLIILGLPATFLPFIQQGLLHPTQSQDKPVFKESKTNQRFYTILLKHHWWFPESFQFLDKALEPVVLKADADSDLSRSTGNPSDEKDLALAEQEGLVHQGIAYLRSNEKAFVSITGKRGRGKTTILARLANELLRAKQSFRITASHPSALNSFFKHCHAPQDCFVSIADAKKGLETNTLFIDEAANLPLATIEHLTSIYPQLVTSTTMDGYENAGMAFQIRLMSKLGVQYQKVLTLKPLIAWRWQSRDIIEQFIDRLTLNDTDDNPPNNATITPSAIAKNCINDTRVAIQEISQQQLLANESLLKSIFHLFKTTHYQTSLKDINHLLDGHQVKLWIATVEKEDCIIGAIMACEEGKVESRYHNAIVSKRRRLPHQLLPQLLAQAGDSENALEQKYLRIIRISVKEEWRRLKCASKLLQEAESFMMNSNTDAIGASFAGDTRAKAFWQANGYTQFHQGFRLNPRTGIQATAVLKTYSEVVDKVLQKAVNIHHDNAHYLKHSNPDTNPVADTNPCTDAKPSGYDDKELLTRFANNQRSANDTYAALYRLARQSAIELKRQHGVSQKSHEKSLRQQVARHLDILAD